MKEVVKYTILLIFSAILMFVAIEPHIEKGVLFYSIVLLFTVFLFFILRNFVKNLKLNQLILIFSFLTILSIPLIGKKETVSLEKRALVEFPTMKPDNIWAFFFGFCNYFSDRFAFRNIAVNSISKFKYLVLQVSPIPNKVTIGKDDWLFLTSDKVIDETCTEFSSSELKKLKLNLDITTKWFDEHNIKFYISIIPFKSRIYPEMMPEQLQGRMAVTNYLQLIDYLKNDTLVRIIDVSPELLAGKNVRPAYYKSDTHWNEYGAFIGYSKIINRVKEDFPQINPYVFSDFTIDSSKSIVGDLQYMMGFSDIIKSPQYILNFNKPVYPEITKKQHPGMATYDETRIMPDKVNGLKLVMIHDSFTQYLKKYFSPHFDASHYYCTPLVPARKIEMDKPDIVIQEILEQFIVEKLQLPEDIKNDTAFLRKNFPEYGN